MTDMALVDVRDIVEWLRRTEERVGTLYARAAETCMDDPSFRTFLQGLSEDEKSHARFMALACELLDDVRNRPPLDVLLDEPTRDQVEGLLERFDHLLARTRPAKRDIIEYIARAETSELNPVFLYVAESCAKTGREGERMTGEIHTHLLHIQNFIDGLPRNLRPSVNVGTLPFVGERRFLVVEDHPALRQLLTSLLTRRGTVDAASEGQEALEKVHVHFHDSVVTDVQMPRMDGLEFYRRAIEYDPHLKGRFLFCSGEVTPANESYLKEHNLPVLRKPFGLEDFQAAMDRIMTPDGKTQPGG